MSSSATWTWTPEKFCPPVDFGTFESPYRHDCLLNTWRKTYEAKLERMKAILRAQFCPVKSHLILACDRDTLRAAVVLVLLLALFL